MLLTRLRMTLDMIKFEHSVFALPFALTGALLAWREGGFRGAGLAMRFVWILVSMVAARSVAMAFNRVLDQAIDAKNPRTKMRHLPAGLLSRKFAWGFIAFWASPSKGAYLKAIRGRQPHPHQSALLCLILITSPTLKSPRVRTPCASA